MTSATPSKSWVTSANHADSHFPIQNLPFGVFTTASSTEPRVGVAIGDAILDLSVLESRGVLTGRGKLFAQPTLNAFMASGRDSWRAVRAQLTELLSESNATLRDDAALRESALVPQSQATMHLPVEIPGYTEFYPSR